MNNNKYHTVCLILYPKTYFGLKISRLVQLNEGMEATIAGDTIDMKFKNARTNPIFVQTYVDNEHVVVNIYEIQAVKS